MSHFFNAQSPHYSPWGLRPSCYPGITDALLLAQETSIGNALSEGLRLSRADFSQDTVSMCWSRHGQRVIEATAPYSDVNNAVQRELATQGFARPATFATVSESEWHAAGLTPYLHALINLADLRETLGLIDTEPTGLPRGLRLSAVAWDVPVLSVSFVDVFNEYRLDYGSMGEGTPANFGETVRSDLRARSWAWTAPRSHPGL